MTEESSDDPKPSTSTVRPRVVSRYPVVVLNSRAEIVPVARQKSAHGATFWVCSFESGGAFPTVSLPVAVGGPSTKRECVNIQEEAQAWSA